MNNFLYKILIGDKKMWAISGNIAERFHEKDSGGI